MRRIFFIILLSIFANLGLNAQNTSYLDDEAITEFTKKLTKLPFSERDVIIKACEIYEKDFSNNPDLADWAFQVLYFYHEISCNDKSLTLHKTFSDEEIRGYFLNDIYILPKLKSDISAFIKEYAQWGYRIATFEDTSYRIEVDSSFLYKKFEKYLSREYSYYLSNYISDCGIPSYWHATLNVPLSEIMRRIEWRDLFLKENPEFIRHDLVIREIEYLMFSVAKGLENTPIYDEKDVILPEYKDAIQAYYRTHTETNWGLFLTEFMHRLSLNKYRHSHPIDLFVMNKLFPEDRKNIDPLLKYKDILIDNLMD